jgi:hypothetical protein
MVGDEDFNDSYSDWSENNECDTFICPFTGVKFTNLNDLNMALTEKFTKDLHALVKLLNLDLYALIRMVIAIN